MSARIKSTTWDKMIASVGEAKNYAVKTFVSQSAILGMIEMRATQITLSSQPQAEDNLINGAMINGVQIN